MEGTKMQKKTVQRIVILILIILWMIMVFGFSNQDGDDSSNLSREVTKIIVDEEEEIDIVEPYVRKVAHLSEYTLGGMLFISLFLTYNLSDIKRMFYSLLIGTEYAVVDEIHQLFVAGRAGKITDIFIDDLGILLGICIVMLLYKIAKKVLFKIKEGVVT